MPIGIPVPYGPASPYPSTIRVRGLAHGRIVKVCVSLNGLSHTLTSGLDAMVVAPGMSG